MPTQNVSLSEQQVAFIRKGIKDGRFRNSSEVVRAGLRLLEEQEKRDKLKLQELKRMFRKAFDDMDRGDYITVEPGQLDAFMDTLGPRKKQVSSK